MHIIMLYRVPRARCRVAVSAKVAGWPAMRKVETIYHYKMKYNIRERWTPRRAANRQPVSVRGVHAVRRRRRVPSVYETITDNIFL